jgi:hypothetical protein
MSENIQPTSTVNLDPDAIAQHVITLLGGHDKAFAAFDSDLNSLNERWQQDTSKIGRILRAHLYVEHYLEEYIQIRNPGLAPLEDCRLTFFQKVSLIRDDQPTVSFLLPGIRRLNAIRNRLAHSLQADINHEDANVFLQVANFAALRNEKAKRSQTPANSDPLSILEEFSLFAGLLLHQGPMMRVFGEAISLAHLEGVRAVE